jgi:hypothetical protein
MIKSASVDGWMCWLESNRRPTRGGGAGPLISILSLIKYAGGNRRRRPRRTVVTQVRGCCSPRRERSFLDQSNARVFSITFAVVIRVDRRGVFVIVADAERTAASSGLDGASQMRRSLIIQENLFGSVSWC